MQNALPLDAEHTGMQCRNEFLPEATYKCCFDAVSFRVARIARLLSGLRSSALLREQVCLEDFEEGAELLMLPCLHRFHPHCIGPTPSSDFRGLVAPRFFCAARFDFVRSIYGD